MADTIFQHDDEINTFLLLQLGQYQDEVKKNFSKVHTKLNIASTEATKKYDKALDDDEGVLLGLFLKLKDAEEKYQGTLQKLSDLIISRKDQELLEAGELISTLEEAVQNCQLKHGSASNPESNTGTNEGATEPEKTSEKAPNLPKDQEHSNPIEAGVAEALITNAKPNAVVTTEDVFEDYDRFPAVIKKRKVSSVINLDSSKGE